MIISASRRTDIPAFYLEWFLNRLKDGHALVRNPINPRQVSRVSLAPEAVECIVFWTKNPAPLLGALDRLTDYPFYVQFTLNPYDYDLEGELPQAPASGPLAGRKHTLPGKSELLDTFRRLSDKIGPERVVWRYSPALFNAKYTEEFHLERFGELAGELLGYTRQCKLSFLDIYPKIRRSMAGCGVLPYNREIAGGHTAGQRPGLTNSAGAAGAEFRNANLFEHGPEFSVELDGRKEQLTAQNSMEGIRDEAQPGLSLSILPLPGADPECSAQLPPERRLTLARRFQAIAAACGIEAGACGDAYLMSAGFPAANCVDRELIEKITGQRLRIRKDPGQRSECLCAESADIGAYDTCLHACRYCYANRSISSALTGMREHDPASPLLRGRLEPGDKVSERKVKMHAVTAKEKSGEQQFSLY